MGDNKLVITTEHKVFHFDSPRDAHKIDSYPKT